MIGNIILLFRAIILVWKIYPTVRSRVLVHFKNNKYAGEVKHQIAYREVLKLLAPTKLKNVSGSIIYLAISIAYILNNPNKKTL